MFNFKHRALTLLAVVAVGAAGCSGNGATGPTGDTGAQGAQGAPGTSATAAGTISGTLTYMAGTTSTPASAVTVSTLPATSTATSDANGNYTLANVPVGIYSVVFSGNGYTSAQVGAVSVLAGQTYTVNQVLVAANPLVVTSTTPLTAVGFNRTATASLTVSGGSGNYTYTWSPTPAGTAPNTVNPTPITVSGSGTSATFTTGTLAAIMASPSVLGLGYGIGTYACAALPTSDNSSTACSTFPGRAGYIGVTAQQVQQMTYSVNCLVKDTTTGWTKTISIAIPPVNLAQGSTSVPVNSMVIANLPGNTTTLTLSVANTTGTSQAQLQDAGTVNPWFVPDVPGDYTIMNGANAALPTVTAGRYVSASPSCGVCHSNVASDPTLVATVAAKFKAWTNSAHDNYYFDSMSYDANGNLQWNAGVTQLATSSTTVNWPTSAFPTAPGNNGGTTVLPIPLFEFGIAGGEGGHYSGSCIGCHTTGYNLAVSDNGFDDVATSWQWSFPNLNTSSTYAAGVPATPNLTAWNAMPAAVKQYVGMQCESCHGPMGEHLARSAAAPKGEYAIDACAVCHDKPTNHDKVYLWRKSKHSDMETAVSEGAGTTNSPSNSCNRCHSAQGFAQYMAQLQGTLTYPDGKAVPAFGGVLLDPTSTETAPVGATAGFLIGLGITPATVQPQTCQACHDPHTTQLRVSGSVVDQNKNLVTLPAGFTVSGAGNGAICFVCHNSRNGARNDFATVVSGEPQFYNNPLPGAAQSTGLQTSIGGPHEANQGDVLMGVNAFWMPASNPSKHLAVADTCAGCHMKIFPAGLTGSNTNHTFTIDTTSCATCHGSEVDGAGIQAQFATASTALGNALSAAAIAPVQAGSYVKGKSQTVQIVPSNIASIQFVSGRSPGFVITFTAAINNPDATSGQVTSLGSANSPYTIANFYSDAGVTPIFDQLSGRVAKANWNYSLVTQDGSQAIHNPTFVFGVISATNTGLADTTKKL